MNIRGTRIFAVLATILALFAGMLASLAATAAQDASTPAAGDIGGEERRLSASINNGTCDEPGDVAFELNEATTTDDAGTPQAAADADTIASPAAQTGRVGGDVAESTTEVDASLEELVDEEYVITVHEGAGAANTYLACGEITGSPVSGALQIDLAELDESGVSGTAMLTANDDGTTTVVMLLTEGDIDTRGTPQATPAS